MTTCFEQQETIVATKNLTLRESKTLELLLDSILHDPKFAELKVKLATHIRAASKDTTYRDAHFSASRFLNERLNMPNTPADETLFREALREFHAFFSRAIDSEKAYDPQTKPNPEAVFWPNPAASGKGIYDEIPFVKPTPLIDKTTPIGSAGSCFASEISTFLNANGYNYIVTEPNEWSSAAWGGLFNTPSFRQLAEFVFGMRQRPKLVFECDETGKMEFWDPYREGIFFASVQEYEQSFETHIVNARKALLDSEVFVMTIGLNEVWRLSLDDSVLARYPRSLASHLVYKQILTVEQNVRELQRFLDILRAHNHKLKLIITVSPIPMYATFRADDYHVVTATCHAKSVLRVAVEEFVRANPGVAHYFPAYEVVNYCTKTPFVDDGRHVTKEAVTKVMGLFEKTFARP